MDVPRAALLRAGVPLTGGAMTKKSHELFDLEAAFKPDDTCPDCRIDRLGYKKNVDDNHCWRSHGTDKTEVAQPVVSEGDPADLAVTLDIAAGEAPRRRLTNMGGLPRVRGSRGRDLPDHGHSPARESVHRGLGGETSTQTEGCHPRRGTYLARSPEARSRG
jgi:hypothetical protein